MGAGFLIDSNTIIDFLAGRLSPNGAKRLIEIVNSGEHFISPIVQIEVLGFNGEDGKMATVKAFIEGSKSLPIDDKVVAATIVVRRTKKIKLPDAIIAGTAIVHGVIIVTRNERDFRGLDNVRTLNLYSL